MAEIVRVTSVDPVARAGAVPILQVTELSMGERLEPVVLFLAVSG